MKNNVLTTIIIATGVAGLAGLTIKKVKARKESKDLEPTLVIDMEETDNE